VSVGNIVFNQIDRGLSDEPIPCAEVSYRLRCVAFCDLEALKKKLVHGLRWVVVPKKKKYMYIYVYTHTHIHTHTSARARVCVRVIMYTLKKFYC
jgi:hypothetical protein